MDLLLALFQEREAPESLDRVAKVLESIERGGHPLHQAIDLDAVQGHLLDLPDDLRDLPGGEEPEILGGRRVRRCQGNRPVREEHGDQEFHHLGARRLAQRRLPGRETLPDLPECAELDAKRLHNLGAGRRLRGWRRFGGQGFLQFLPCPGQAVDRHVVATAFPCDPPEKEEEPDPVLKRQPGDHLRRQMIEGIHRIVPGGGQTDPVQGVPFLTHQDLEHRRRIEGLPGRKQQFRPRSRRPRREEPALFHFPCTLLHAPEEVKGRPGFPPLRGDLAEGVQGEEPIRLFRSDLGQDRRSVPEPSPDPPQPCAVGIQDQGCPDAAADGGLADRDETLGIVVPSPRADDLLEERRRRRRGEHPQADPPLE
ncbi:MAG: hypothetical protein H6Q82_3197 [Deltaproteobacteria bacterium]|nr:hypothetical protein [Deltaproteobacteria bacterium]